MIRKEETGNRTGVEEKRREGRGAKGKGLEGFGWTGLDWACWGRSDRSKGE